ncbi:FadR/GntR family transcriptional regulator [Rhodococcus erythropolis]|uniref:FadR/GntR family transcriptional regulator n=1 Tax=Rhodococcus erythropolis TaxID=1833 RepID=UPI00379021ED
MSNGQYARLNIGAVEVPRPSDVYADLIRAKILSGELPLGSQLPPERMLVAESGLTRAQVREALQTLQRQGLITTKPGRGGGSSVSRPTASEFMSSVDLQLQGWAPGTQMLFESRHAIEPWCAHLAAERRTDSDLARLRAADDRSAEALGSLEDFILEKIEWHAALAAASHNELLSTFMEAVGRAILRQTDIDAHADLQAMTRSLDAHRAITRAISNRDAPLAHRLMAQHVHTPPLLDSGTQPVSTDTCGTSVRRNA